MPAGETALAREGVLHDGTLQRSDWDVKRAQLCRAIALIPNCLSAFLASVARSKVAKKQQKNLLRRPLRLLYSASRFPG
jgi:hypothetical protein